MQQSFHSGEIAVQEMTGERDAAARNIRAVGERIPEKAADWLRRRDHVLLGATDAAGDPWAAFLAGRAGFARPDETGSKLTLTLADVAPAIRGAPPLSELRPGSHVGALFLDLSTRRRLRVNGRVDQIHGDEIVIDVDRANPLCPKYIQTRVAGGRAATDPPNLEQGETLRADLRAWIEQADTFFVATAHPDGPANVSHRGGQRGFARVDDAGVLRIPDYPGNSMFNTFGNLFLNPRAGLTFPDFERNRQLRLTGDAQLDLDGEVGRSWRFLPRRWSVLPLSRDWTWEFVEASPFNPPP